MKKPVWKRKYVHKEDFIHLANTNQPKQSHHIDGSVQGYSNSIA